MNHTAEEQLKDTTYFVGLLEQYPIPCGKGDGVGIGVGDIVGLGV